MKVWSAAVAVVVGATVVDVCDVKAGPVFVRACVKIRHRGSNIVGRAGVPPPTPRKGGVQNSGPKCVVYLRVEREWILRPASDRTAR